MTDEKLGHGFFKLPVRLEQLPESDVGVDDIRNALGWIETSDLNDIVTGGPLQLMHLLLSTKASELSHIKLRIPSV